MDENVAKYIGICWVDEATQLLNQSLKSNMIFMVSLIQIPISNQLLTCTTPINTPHNNNKIKIK